MRRGLLVGLVFGLVLLATPVAASDKPYLDEDFSAGSMDFNSAAWGFKTVSGHVGDGVAAVIPAGKHWGGNAHFYFNSKGFDEPDELWWRYWIKFPAEFVLGDRDGGKLPGPAGLYNYRCLGGKTSTVEQPCWSARNSFTRNIPEYGAPDYPQGPDGVAWMGTYAYHLDGPTGNGDSLRWAKDPGVLTYGRWYCIEGHLRLNTPGANNGVIEAWVDGKNAYSRSDFAFRRVGEEWMHIQDFWFLGYYGGDNPSPAYNEIHFDSVSLAPFRVGCDDSIVHQEALRDLRGTTFPTEIEWLVDRGVSLGCNPPDNNRFCPYGAVTRGEMAAFLTRALGLTPTVSPFGDTSGSVFEGEIGALAAAGITAGCAVDRFCPQDPVTREQMAAFLRRAFTLYRPNTDTFVDDDDSLFEADIEALRYAGITTGCATELFCPRALVTRQEMAAFLYRALTG